MLAASGLDAVLLNAQHNFAWLTGGGLNGVDTSRENGVATLMITREGRRYLLVNNIETPRMIAEEVSANDFEPLSFAWQAEKANGSLVAELAMSVVGPAAAIASDIMLAPAVSAIEGKIAGCRHQLTSGEQARYRELGNDAGAAMQRTIAGLNAGETELEIAEKLRHGLAAANMTSVVTLVAADERIAQFRHPVPTANRWKKTLLLVTCARRFGLIVSLSRMVTIGSPDADLIHRTDAAAFVNATLLDAARPGITGAELYAAAERAYEQAGFGGEIDLHHQGGAAGYKTRDWVAHPISAEVVKVDQAFAWNPSITGTKVEETVIVTETGVETITISPDFPQIEATVGGRQYFSPGILSL